MIRFSDLIWSWIIFSAHTDWILFTQTNKQDHIPITTTESSTQYKWKDQWLQVKKSSLWLGEIRILVNWRRIFWPYELAWKGGWVPASELPPSAAPCGYPVMAVAVDLSWFQIWLTCISNLQKHELMPGMSICSGLLPYVGDLAGFYWWSKCSCNHEDAGQSISWNWIVSINVLKISMHDSSEVHSCERLWGREERMKDSFILKLLAFHKPWCTKVVNLSVIMGVKRK